MKYDMTRLCQDCSTIQWFTLNKTEINRNTAQKMQTSSLGEKKIVIKRLNCFLFYYLNKILTSFKTMLFMANNKSLLQAT